MGNRSIGERIRGLEEEIKLNLLRTNLIKDINIYHGNLQDSPYLEYKIKNANLPKQQKKVNVLREFLLRRLFFCHPEIKDINQEYDEKTSIYRESLIFQEQIDLKEEQKLTYGFLSSLNKDIKNYLIQTKKT